jgi:hypothetical protein
VSLKIEPEKPGECGCRQTYRIVDLRTGVVLVSDIKSHDTATRLKNTIERGKP